MNTKVVPLKDLHAAEWDARLDVETDDVTELAQSIAEVGLLNPLTVIETSDGYTVIAGRRRLKACQQLGLAEVPVNIVEMTAQDLDSVALVENIQRKGLGPVEECLAFETFLDHHGVTQEQLAQRIGKSREYVAKRLMLRDLDEVTVRATHAGEISLSVAIELKRVQDINMRTYFLSHAITYGASVATVRGWVETYLREGDRSHASMGAPGQGGVEYTPQAVYFTCFACGQSFEPGQIKSVFLCSEDHKALHMATRGERG